MEAIQTALKRCSFLSQFSKKNAIVKDGTFDTGTNQSTCALLYAFLEGCLRYVRDGAPEEWARGDGSDGMLTINRGIQAVIRVLNDIVNLLMARGDISPKSQRPEELVRQVSFYLDPLNEYLAHLSPQERKSLRGYFGGGADTRFWRAFQREIARARSDFRPAGLTEYWESEISACHEDSQICLRAAVCYVKDTVRTALRQKYGQNWEVLGLPKSIYKRAKSEADLKNYDLVAAGGTREAVSIWDCVTLKECRDVVIAGSHWAELFDTALTRPEERRLSGGKIAKTRWMERMDTLQNKLRLPSARITPADLHLLQAVYLWIQEISGGTAAS